MKKTESYIVITESKQACGVVTHKSSTEGCSLGILYILYLAFNTVQVISRQVVLWAKETSTYSLVKGLYCKV